MYRLDSTLVAGHWGCIIVGKYATCDKRVECCDGDMTHDKHKLHGDLDDGKGSTYCAALPDLTQFILDIKTIVLKGFSFQM